MNPSYLATLVFIGSNFKVYMPPTKDIWQLYLRKFTKNGKLLEMELGDSILMADEDESAPAPAPAPGPAPASASASASASAAP